METLRLNKAVRRVVALRPGSSGALTPTVLYERQGKKNKTSPALKPFEKAERGLAKAHIASWDSYLTRHDRSNEKKRDGWARDYVANVSRAAEAGEKQLRP